MEELIKWKNKYSFAIAEQYEGSEFEMIWRIILEDGLSRNRMSNDPLSIQEQERLLHFLSELIEERPIQYVVGKALFFEHYFKVNEAVLIPRVETEELVRIILENHKEKNIRLLDIGTGGGCIPISLQLRNPDWDCVALDISEEALDIAEENCSALKTKVHFLHLDFLDENQCSALGKFNLIVSNPPYIDEQERSKMSKSVLDYEPSIALFPLAKDPLIFYQKIAAFSQVHLLNGGMVYVELNEFNALEVLALFESEGYDKVTLHKDLQGKNRMLSAMQV